MLDEPTSMLDPSARAEILDLLKAIQDETETAYIFISHDLTSVAKISHRKAKALLAEAGFADGLDAELSFCVCDAAQESIAILLQSDFKKAGIDLSLKKLPTAAWSDNVMSKGGSLAIWTDMPIQPDINYALKLVWPTNALVNYHNFADSKVDQVLKDGEGVVDPDARIAAHAGIQEHIHDLAPLGWIGEHYFAVGLSRKVGGFRWYTTQYYHVSEMSLAD